MNTPNISIIAAVSSTNRALGKNGKLLWYIPEDLKRFKQLTTGHPIIMGRKTFESIGTVLPSRTNIIITKDPNYIAEGCVVVHSLEEAISQSLDKPGSEEVFIIGGGEIYTQALPLATKLYLTVVEGEYEADTFFPDYSDFNHVVSESEAESGEYEYKFLELVKDNDN